MFLFYFKIIRQKKENTVFLQVIYKKPKIKWRWIRWNQNYKCVEFFLLSIHVIKSLIYNFNFHIIFWELEKIYIFPNLVLRPGSTFWLSTYLFFSAFSAFIIVIIFFDLEFSANIFFNFQYKFEIDDLFLFIFCCVFAKNEDWKY